MVTVNVSSDCRKAIKEYVIDVEDLSIGEMAELCILFTFEHLDDFQEWAEEEGYFEEQEEFEEVEEEEG